MRRGFGLSVDRIARSRRTEHRIPRLGRSVQSPPIRRPDWPPFGTPDTPFGAVECSFGALDTSFDTPNTRFDTGDTRFDAVDSPFVLLYGHSDAAEGSFCSLYGHSCAPDRARAANE